jgi:hypothetical protein
MDNKSSNKRGGYMKLIDRINQAANDYNKTKDEKYKIEWYKLIKEYSRLYAYAK